LVNYPSLSQEQQQTLAELVQVTALPAMYDDSTNRLWHCETVDGPMMLKVCEQHTVKSSTFWQGMQSLFDINLPRQLEHFAQLYSLMNKLSCLAIPEYIASGSASEDEGAEAFILARFLPGKMVESSGVDDEMVTKLAKQISQLHQSQRATWGAVYSQGMDVRLWGDRLRKTLITLVNKSNTIISSDIWNEALAEIENCTVESFVPIMPDLRWDQFLQQDGKLTALVDLDAIVYGPRELELVLLEFLLDEQHAAIFSEEYQQLHSLPDLSLVRKSYRLLLFMMNVLGEKNVDAWMQAPTRF